MAEKTELQRQSLARLKNGANRLVKLLELNAPDVIIANEIGMLVQRGAGLCGEDILKFVGKSVARFERWRLGCCMEDGCGCKLTTEDELMEGLCCKHIEEAKAEAGENWVPRREWGQ